jgi:Tfp pilus assembly protein PilV
MNARGFSLIEVNIAILVVAGGLLSLFSLFPAGLRMSTAAMSDTRQALFADDFFAYFDDGVRQIDNRDDWQNIESFWKAARAGLDDGFSDATLNDKDWNGDAAVRKDWDVNASDMKKGNPNSGNRQNLFYLRFRNGTVKNYFSDNLDAEFLVRIASDAPGDSGLPQDGLLWRVSLVVSDEGPNGWYYDNPVYHRDFRYAELP